MPHNLVDGTSIPEVGLGTGGLKGADGIRVITYALDNGCRLIDTAASYETEKEVGTALRLCGVADSEVRVITKLAGKDHGRDATIRAIDRARVNLMREVIDIFLIHWPLPRQGLFLESYEAMLDMQQRGHVRTIGVSNFTAAHINLLIDETGVVPAINQVELHPRFQQAPLRRFHATHNIATIAWSPFCKGQFGVLEDRRLTAIAEMHGVAVHQVILAWHRQRGVIPIPKSRRKEHIRSNLHDPNLVLSSSEIDEVSAIEVGIRRGGDPDTHEE